MDRAQMGQRPGMRAGAAGQGMERNGKPNLSTRPRGTRHLAGPQRSTGLYPEIQRITQFSVSLAPEDEDFVTRILFVLGWFAVLMVAAALVLGLSIGDLRHNPVHETLNRALVHRIMGVAAALVVVLVNSIVVTYFVGTSRWCKEVVESYGLDRSLIVRAARIKRRAFPWAVLAMLAMVVVVAMGGATDPLNGSPTGENWRLPHLMGALGGLALIALVLLIEWNYVYTNFQIINEIMSEVRRVRIERGLDVEETQPASARHR